MQEKHLREAIRLSIDHLSTSAAGPFGAVIARNGEVIGRGFNKVTSTNDPTAHAEVVAIRDACARLRSFSLDGCELYASCEPCPMCLAASYWARIESITFAASSEDAAAAGFDDRHFYDELALPMEERTVPMRQLLRDEACTAFAAWRAKADRIEY